MVAAVLQIASFAAIVVIAVVAATLLLDFVLFGARCEIRGRRVALTGASGALGAPMKNLLEKEGAASVKALKFGVDYGYGDYGRLDETLRNTDILVLCHGSKKDQAMEANCDSFVAI